MTVTGPADFPAGRSSAGSCLRCTIRACGPRQRAASTAGSSDDRSSGLSRVISSHDRLVFVEIDAHRRPPSSRLRPLQEYDYHPFSNVTGTSDRAITTVWRRWSVSPGDHVRLAPPSSPWTVPRQSLQNAIELTVALFVQRCCEMIVRDSLIDGIASLAHISMRTRIRISAGTLALGFCRIEMRDDIVDHLADAPPAARPSGPGRVDAVEQILPRGLPVERLKIIHPRSRVATVP